MSLMVLMFFVDKTSLELVYLKQKRISKKKVVCLKKNFMWGEKKTYSRISFVLACKALMSFFFLIVDYLDVFVFSKMWFFFSFKEKKWKYIVPNSKGTSFLELQCVSCEK